MGGSGRVFCWERAGTGGRALSRGWEKHGGLAPGSRSWGATALPGLGLVSTGSPAGEMHLGGKNQIGGFTCKHHGVATL